MTFETNEKCTLTPSLPKEKKEKKKKPLQKLETIVIITQTVNAQHDKNDIIVALWPYLLLSTSFGKLMVNLQRDARKEFKGSTA